ncbi:hypothetical protein SKAU_G00379980 [Synaphobranchus kaupii]|uniref:Uncharacterized protein n=1 Tax=Synaphobranchus kaupii TaxID=118154 RepID=A0A9Q1ICJ4_SYNKA|nr:hypothetical protein SKAU_G00379980 [Synaphobranchus kaupii]
MSFANYSQSTVITNWFARDWFCEGDGPDADKPIEQPLHGSVDRPLANGVMPRPEAPAQSAHRAHLQTSEGECQRGSWKSTDSVNTPDERLCALHTNTRG